MSAAIHQPTSPFFFPPWKGWKGDASQETRIDVFPLLSTIMSFSAAVSLTCTSLSVADKPFFFSPSSWEKMLTSPNLWLTCVTVHLMYLASTRLVNIKFSTQFRLHTLKASSARWIELQRWNEKPRNYPLNRGFTRAGIHPGGKKSEVDLHCRRPASFFFPFTVMSQSTVTFREGQWKRHPFKAEWAEHPLVLSSSDKVGSWSNTLVRWFGLMGC